MDKMTILIEEIKDFNLKATTQEMEIIIKETLKCLYHSEQQVIKAMKVIVALED